MKYLILIYANPRTWVHPLYQHDPGFLGLDEAEQARIVERAEAVHAEIVASGELVEGVALADPLLARSVRPAAGGGATVTDGPYLESKEQLAGYLVVDCETPERAVEIAASFPDTGMGGGVEIRPVMGEGGEEM